MLGSVGSLRWLLFVVLCCFEFCGWALLLGKAGVCLGCVLVILVLVLPTVGCLRCFGLAGAG